MMFNVLIRNNEQFDQNVHQINFFFDSFLKKQNDQR